MQISFPTQFTTQVHTLLYQLTDGFSGDWNKQQKAMAAVQKSTARKGHGHETIQFFREEHLARECLELHFIACPESPALWWSAKKHSLVQDTGEIRWEGLFLFCIPNKALYIFKSRTRQYIFTTGEVSVRISTLPFHRTFLWHFSYAHANTITDKMAKKHPSL